MLDAGAPSQAKRTPDFGRYLPLSAGWAPKPRLVAGHRRTMGERSAELPEGAWREITVAEGS